MGGSGKNGESGSRETVSLQVSEAITRTVYVQLLCAINLQVGPQMTDLLEKRGFSSNPNEEMEEVLRLIRRNQETPWESIVNRVASDLRAPIRPHRLA